MSSDHAADDEAIQRRFSELLDGWNAGDGAGFAAPFTDRVDFIAFDGAHLETKHEIETVHQELFDRWLRGSRLTGAATIRYLSDDVALVIARGDTTMRNKARPAPERDSIQTMTAVRSGDGWSFTSFQNTRVRLIGQGTRSALVWLTTDKLWKWFGGRRRSLSPPPGSQGDDRRAAPATA